ncbi:MAG: ferredoxin [Actinobacteria bacterium]|nr:ferredoxin [Actinomycetota bacterium]
MTTHEIVIDPIACDGAGICAELLPAHIHLDDWGFPIVHDPIVTGADQQDADRARRACPKLAISLQRRPG